MTRQVHCKGKRMSIEGEMTVYTAASLAKQVLAGLAKRAAIRLLDLSKVSEIDTAGLQILLVARRQAAALGRELQIVTPSSAVGEVFQLLQLTALTGVPASGTNLETR
jgi:anti-sigma B factor antagonist